MSDVNQWEYRVENLGTALKSPNDAEIEAILNEWGEAGWDVFEVIQHSGTNKVRLIAKRPLTNRERRRRTMPGRDG